MVTDMVTEKTPVITPQLAAVPESTISQLMGHKKQSISLHLYSGGLEFTRLQQEIERIKFVE